MAERRKLGRPSFSPTRKEAFRKDSNMSKKMFRDKKRQKRDEALSTVVPPTATRYKHIRVTTATFWRWRSLAQELGLDGDEQMASFLLNTYYERAVEAASQEQRQDIPPNSEESRQIVETSMFPDDEQGTETDAIGSTSTTLPMQATQDGSIGLLLTEPPPDSMKEQVEDDWRGGDGDKTNDGGEMVLEGKFTCLIKTEPHESGEESNEQEALPSVSQQGDSLAGDDRKEIEEVEFKCLIKEEPDDGEHNQPSCSQQGGNSSKQSSCQEIGNTQIISGDTSHDRSHGRHLPGDHPLQGTLSHSSPRGNCSSGNVGKHSSCQQKANTQIISGDSSHDRSHGKHLPGDYPLQGAPSHSSPRGNRSSGDSRGQRSHHKESALIISGDPSVDTSHDGPRGEHLPEDFPIQTILGNLAGLSARGSYSGEYDSHLLPNQGNYATDSATMSDDHEEERLNLKTDNAMGLGEKCETAYSKQKSSQISSTRTNQSNPCINSAGEQLFTCSVCQKGYNRKHNLYRHMRLHSGDRPHECTYCKKRFWQSSELKGHLRIHTGQKPYSCSVCDRQFRFSSNLNKHMAVHLRKRRKYQCAFCDEGFSTRALRDAHIASAHPSGDSRGQRSHHKESALIISGDPSVDTSHDGPRGEHLPEDFPIQTILGNLAGLSARGSYSGEYDSHLLPNQGNYATDSATMSDDHEEERLNLKTDNAMGLGEKCETAYSKQKSSQISSTRTNQSNPCINSAGEQLFTCSVCQKGYNRKHNLYRHMRLHSGDRPHECTYCKKRFWQSSELKGHLRIHTGQKPYSCSVCDKQFRFSSNLNKHMAVHLRKRRKYQCAFCDEGFSTRALRDAHIASAHPSGDSRGQRSHHKESALTMSGDPSGDTSHDRPRGEHLPEDFPIQTVLGNLAGLSARGSYSGEYDSHLLPNQGNYATDSATMSDDHEEERLNLKTDAIGLGEKCETASSKQKSSQISSTRTKQSNPCINSAGEQLFTCSVCQKGYNRKHNLYRHMRLHSGERPHECTYCKKRFWQSSELKRHLRIHTGQKPYSCSVCDKQFRFSSNLKKHMAVHLRKRRKYQCAFCDEGFSTRALRDAHSASAHPSGDSRGQSSHHKESALKMSGDPSGDTSHDGPRGEHLPEDFPIQTVLGNLAGLSTRGSFSSEYGAHLLPNQGDYSQWQSPTMSDDHKEGRLDLKTDNARELDEKSSNVSSTSTNQTNLCINQQLFTCSVCQKGYNRKHNLYRHMRLHSGERPHECTYCKKRFWQSSELKRHLRIHTGQKPYSCSVCDKQFRDTSNLKVHMAVHLRKKKKYQCSFCDEGFSTRALRDTHSASAHPSEKPFHCMECDMRFCRRGSLQVHIWRTHTARDKPHVCSFCNKAFSHLCFLTTHKRIHTGEKPYECTVCGDRFSFHTQLADHKAKHTGVKPYSCSICEKRFWRKSCLNRHQRTHTGKKPFQCPECKKGFAEKSTLIKHLNTHPNL
ncbi:zinc finger protein Xfin-like isoform X2 [Lytechinus variegatus]|uniref:zinc finger protein Xfin-like isoform X2 n=1 Tax=Lytechinus variegatus TaxID=7654 RepID=UPI001BB2BD31|nr:zinc finger protein Xfin-like isoform X2 [Lytechinus variegatus]